MTNDYGVEIQREPQLCTIPLEEYESLKKRIAELESQLENVQNAMYTENVDANMALVKANERIKELEVKQIVYKESLEVSKSKVCELYERIDELESENERLKTQVPKWHDFDEKNPPKGDVLCLHEDGLQNVGCYVKEDRTFVGFGPIFLERVTNWMPLPPPPPTEESSETKNGNG